MAVTSKNLFGAQYIGTGTSILFTTTGVTNKIEAATATNRSGSDATITVFAVPNNGSPGASNTVVSAQRIRPGESYLLPELIGQTFENGESLQAQASAASSIVVRVSGLEIV